MTIQRVFETKWYNENKPPQKTWSTDPTMIKLKFLRENLNRAANRGENSQDINIDVDYLYELGEKQKWKCALTGVPLQFTRGGTFWGRKWCNPKSCTIDRVDSNRGYVTKNIQLITWDINKIKGDVPNNELIELAKLIVKNAKKNQ